MTPERRREIIASGYKHIDMTEEEIREWLELTSTKSLPSYENLVKEVRTLRAELKHQREISKLETYKQAADALTDVVEGIRKESITTTNQIEGNLRMILNVLNVKEDENGWYHDIPAPAWHEGDWKGVRIRH